MSLRRPSTPSGDRIRDIGTPVEEQERSALDAFFDLFDFSDGGPSGGVSNEFPGQTWTPPSREGSFGPGFLPAVAPTPTDTNIIDTIKSIPGAAVDTAKSAADTLLKQIQEFLPFYDQSQVVLNPRTGQATVVFGTPPSGSPVIQAGNLPKSNTNVGITTGISILDQAINSVLGKEGGLSSGSIRDEAIKVIFEQAGLDPAAAAVILGEDWGTVLANANTAAAETLSRFNIDLTGEKDDVVRETGTPVVKGPPAGDQMGPTLEELVRGGGSSDTGGVFGGGDLTPEDLGEGDPVVTMASEPDRVVSVGASSPAAPAAPPPSQGMRMESTEKAGLADINNTFDLDSTFMENLIRALSGKDEASSEVSYYSGGKVAPYAGVDEIIRLLRG